MASNLLSFLPLLLLLTAAASAAPVNITASRDITKVLDQFPNFSILNKLLTQTKVAEQINSRQTITVLVVANSAMSSSVTSLPADVLQKVLSVHVILDYYDINKISNLPNATALLTTLLQASGNAVGKAGFLNATDVGDGQVKLGSGVDDSLTSDVIREIAMQPYNISVIEISQAIVPPGIASTSNGSASSSSAPASAPRGETPSPKAAPVSPKAAPVPKASTSPSPSASSPSPKSNSSNETPAPTTDAPSAEAPATAPSSEGPAASPSADSPAGSADVPASSADTPASSADAPAGSTADEKASSASSLALGVGIGTAMGAVFLVVL